jgi:3',5'-cyclic AMP phosphodiesterase CpdA
MLRIAHVSDLHLVSPLGVECRRIIFNKRVTGLTKLLLHRARMYNAQYLAAVLETAAAQADHVVVTGDLTNLSLDSEYVLARQMLDALADKVDVTVIPGNHDLYVQDVVRRERFSVHFERFMRSDLPEHAVRVPAGLFPFVQLRRPVALIGLSSAVPRPPFVSAGYVGRAQIAALRAILEDPQVNPLTPVILVHHDPLDSRFRFEQVRSGLIDASRLRATLSSLGRGMILFGHRTIWERKGRSHDAAARSADGAGASPRWLWFWSRSLRSLISDAARLRSSYCCCHYGRVGRCCRAGRRFA